MSRWAHYFFDLARVAEANAVRGRAAVDKDIAVLEELLARHFGSAGITRDGTRWLVVQPGPARPELAREVVDAFRADLPFEERLYCQTLTPPPGRSFDEGPPSPREAPASLPRPGVYHRALRSLFVEAERRLSWARLEEAWASVMAAPVNQVLELGQAPRRREEWSCIDWPLTLTCPWCGGTRFDWEDGANDAASGTCLGCRAELDFRWGSSFLHQAVPPKEGRLDLRRCRSLVVLTGAGISAASGMPLYAGAGREALQNLGPPGGSDGQPGSDPAEIWRFFGPMREQALQAEPNPGHLALAELERDFPGQFTLVTQNVDGLHGRAGSARLIEMHGSVLRTRCSQCDLPPFLDARVDFPEVPTCPRCAAPLRPDVVLFGEPIDGGHEWSYKRALRECDLFLAVGTSGVVAPASHMVELARFAGARTALINLDEGAGRFDVVLPGRSEELLPRLAAQGFLASLPHRGL